MRKEKEKRKRRSTCEQKQGFREKESQREMISYQTKQKKHQLRALQDKHGGVEIINYATILPLVYSCNHKPLKFPMITEDQAKIS